MKPTLRSQLGDLEEQASIGPSRRQFLARAGSGCGMLGLAALLNREGLLGSAETPFAILFAWLFLTEFPPAASLLGGGVVLAAVFAHAGRDLILARATAAIGGRSRS